MDQTGAVFPFCICHRVFLQRPSQTVIYQISFALNLNSQLSAMDASVRTTMKGAAKCDKHCKLQNSANQQNFERILRFQDMPESMPTSALRYYMCSASLSWVVLARLCASARCFIAVADALSFSTRLRARNSLSASCTFLYLCSSCCRRKFRAIPLAPSMKLGQETR